MIDAHIHLQDKAFDTDRSEQIEAAKSKGITTFLCAATSPDDWQTTLDLGAMDASIIPFIGTHPWYTEKHNKPLLETLLLQYPNACVGEIGLDAIRDTPNQEEIFTEQIEIAAKYHRPCIIHCVRRFDRVLHLIKKIKNLPPAMMFHAFNGSASDIEFLSARNGYFSFSGTSLFANKTKSHDLIRSIPLNRILVETDAPDMMPPPEFTINLGEKRNLPVNLALIIKGIAAIREMDEEELISATIENSLQFYKGQN